MNIARLSPKVILVAILAAVATLAAVVHSAVDAINMSTQATRSVQTTLEQTRTSEEVERARQRIQQQAAIKAILRETQGAHVAPGSSL